MGARLGIGCPLCMASDQHAQSGAVARQAVPTPLPLSLPQVTLCPLYPSCKLLTSTLERSGQATAYLPATCRVRRGGTGDGRGVGAARSATRNRKLQHFFFFPRSEKFFLSLLSFSSTGELACKICFFSPQTSRKITHNACVVNLI